MTELNPKVDYYLSEGCGRCPLGGTPECKVHNWTRELSYLRRLVLESGLKEEVKWGVPCYTFQGANVAIVSALKDYAVLSFFKGALLKNSAEILEKPGENTQSDRIIRFTDSERIKRLEPQIKALLFEAIEVEKAGLKFNYSRNPEPVPAELEAKLAADETYRIAWEKLTPGKKRSYILHFNQAKQLETRISRIEKCRDKVLAGKGFNDR